MLIVLFQILLCAISAGVLYVIARSQMGAQPALARGAAIGVLGNIAVSLFTVLATGYDLYTFTHLPQFAKYVALFALAVVPLYWLVLTLAGMLQLRSDLKTTTPVRLALRVAFYALLFGLAGLMMFGTGWVQSYFGEIAVEELSFVMATGGSNSAGDMFVQIRTYIVIPVLAMLALGLLVGLWRYRAVWMVRGEERCSISARTWRASAAVLASGALIGGTAWFLNAVPVVPVLFPPAASSFIEDNYVAPTSENVHFPETQRNLIHILLESYEPTFYDVAQGGNMEENLLPQLGQLSDENLSFSHTDSKGGFYQVPGATFTMGGIVAQTSGVPLKAPMLRTEVQAFRFPEFATVGDLLEEQGYTNEIITGSNADFASKGDFFREHGDFTVFDQTYAIQHGYLPEGYNVWWGFEDDKLIEYAKSEVTRLAEQASPFYFILETADTHFPDGYLSDNAPTPYSEQLSNVVLYNQEQVTAFVRWIQEQPFYENTTIVITGDHLYMDDSYFERVGVDRDYQRTVFNTIINPAPGVEPQGGTTNRLMTSMDIFPTTLAAMGVTIDGERLGLGTNLYSTEPTLAEEWDIETVQDSLRVPSEFYFEHMTVE